MNLTKCENCPIKKEEKFTVIVGDYGERQDWTIYIVNPEQLRVLEDLADRDIITLVTPSRTNNNDVVDMTN